MKLFALITLVVSIFTLAEVQLSDHESVRRADEELNNLIIEHKAATAANLYADNFQLITSSGKKKSKKQMLDEIGNANIKWEVNETQNVHVVVEMNTAILTGTLHQKGTFNGKEFDNYLIVTDTWIRTASGWQILAGHASLIPKI
jgi:ketosteroid isomerase-like protein